MEYKWYRTFNLDDFTDDDLPSRSIDFTFEDIGLKTILVTKGYNWSIVFDDVYLTLFLNDKNPFEFDSHAVYLDIDDYVWVGILNED